MTLKVEIYSKAGCTYCERAKQLLDDKKVHYTEIHVDANPERLEEMLYRSRGMKTVPQIYINDRLIGGFEDIWTLDQAGRLDPLLKE